MKQQDKNTDLQQASSGYAAAAGLQSEHQNLKEEGIMSDLPFYGFLKNALGQRDFEVMQLAGDASNRRYFRVGLDNRSLVLMVWEPFDELNYPFLSVQKLFKRNGILVPEVVKISPTEGLVLLEDLGDLTLERKFWESQNPEASLDYYKAALDEILKIHFKATADKTELSTAHLTAFDKEKLLWEMNYGKENLIKGILDVKLTDALDKDLTDIFSDICLKLHLEPKFIQHRDYHSRNIMLKLNKTRVIDFQDARLGPVQYDLVSLLRDSYVQMPDQQVGALLNYYLENAKLVYNKDFPRGQFDYTFELQSIQRCFKACGSFASFYVQRGDTRYLKYISGTLKRVMKSLNLFPEYKIFADLLIDSGALERKFELL